MAGTEKIISGAQAGADRAALDFSIERGIPHGGWCPRGRKAEDGNSPTPLVPPGRLLATRPAMAPVTPAPFLRRAPGYGADCMTVRDDIEGAKSHAPE